MTILLRVLVVTAVCAAGTFLLGWWAIPLVAAVYCGGTARQQRGGPVVVSVAAMLSWALLLAITASQGPVGTLAATLGGVLSLKPVGVYAVTIAYPGLLAISAAIVARAVALPKDA